jgi:hypothetical protein
VSPAVVQSVLLQLTSRNERCNDAFRDVVTDYQTCLQRSRELQASLTAQKRSQFHWSYMGLPA